MRIHEIQLRPLKYEWVEIGWNLLAIFLFLIFFPMISNIKFLPFIQLSVHVAVVFALFFPQNREETFKLIYYTWNQIHSMEMKT